MLFEKKIATKAGLAAALLLAASASFAETSKDYTLSCSASGFTGTAYVTAVRNGNLLSVFATDYKINSPSSSASRSEANLNMRIWGSSTNQNTDWDKTNKNLQQDGVKRKIRIAQSITEPRLGSVEFEFVFDRKGSDPRCFTKEMIPAF